MESIHQSDKMKAVLNKGFSVLVLIHICLNMETVFAVPSNIKQRVLCSNKICSETETTSSSKTLLIDSETVFLPELNNVDETMGGSAKLETVSTKMIVPDKGITEKSSVRHQKHKLRKEKKKNRNVSKRKKGKHSRRKINRYRSFGLKQKSCPTRTSYVFKRTAEDIFGDTVDVYPVIHVGKLALDQYFYESFCDTEKCSCAGVDNEMFKSSCQTTHSYTYARIVKSGEIGWSFIKVRTGCSCVIQEKRVPRQTAVRDMS